MDTIGLQCKKVPAYKTRMKVEKVPIPAAAFDTILKFDAADKALNCKPCTLVSR